MFSLFFVISVLSTSTPLVAALVCGSNCRFSGQIDNVPIPQCDEIDKPATEQSCRIDITIDYFSNEITGLINSAPPLPTSQSNFAATTSLSIGDVASNIAIRLTCASKDRCDSEFLATVVQSDWLRPQTQAKNLRTNLAYGLFNPSGVRPGDTCSTSQPCSGDGFCSARYQVWARGDPPQYTSACANSTATPSVQWMQLVTQMNSVDSVEYICNLPSCASEQTVTDIFNLIQTNYKLPFDIPTSTTIAMSKTTTSKPNSASSVRLSRVE